MTIIEATPSTFSGRAAGLWVERRGDGPDVLLVAGLSDPAEAWQFQLDGLADRYRLTAFDNPGAGRTPLPDGRLSLEGMVDASAAMLRATGVTSAHVAGFSGGSKMAQELAIRHPDLVRSLVLVSTWTRLDPFTRRVTDFLRWLADVAPSERAMLEAFFVWIYTARAHNDGTVDQIIEEALAYPHPQPPDAFKAQLQAFTTNDTTGRLGGITVPTLVIAGGLDIITPPRLSREVAEAIPGAEFVVLPEEAHQPFQERPEEFNALVDAFWRKVEQSPAG